MDVHELQDSEEVSTVWVKNRNSNLIKMNNTKLLMAGMKRKDAIKLGIAKLDKSEKQISRVERATLSWFAKILISNWWKTWR